jgi:general stress protein YciG
MAFTKENARQHGQRGGQQTLARHGRTHYQTIGRKGGAATLARHGRAHYQTIGRKGFAVLVERHFGGDRQTCLAWLQAAGLAAQDPFPQNGAWPRRRPWPTSTTTTPVANTSTAR